MKIAVKTLGLDELSPFILEERVIEYMLDDNNTKRLIDMNLSEFTNETSSESPAPGGGSISALWCYGCCSRYNGCQPFRS